MKFIFALSTALLVFSCTQQTSESGTKVTSEATIVEVPAASGVVDVPTFAKLMESDHLLLDVRTPEEFADGYIDNAVNINFFDSDFAERVAALNKSKPVLVYCKKGGRSAKASDILKKAGFEQVYDLGVGFTGWKAAGQPVQKK